METRHGRNLVVYGIDNRYEESEATTAMRAFGQATVLFVQTDRLTEDSNGDWTFDPNAYDEHDGLGIDTSYVLGCTDPMPYTDQGAIGFCSGTLVGTDNTVATAGHCVSTTSGYKVVFNATNVTVASGLFPNDTVFGVSKLLSRQYGTNSDGVNLDYALLKLDAHVSSSIATPVAIRPWDRTYVGESGLMVGYPLGLPRKYNEASVTLVTDPDSTSYYYMFNGPYDAFKGNSGSGVFSMTSDEMFGILVQGKTDIYVSTTAGGDKCVDINVCTESSFGSSYDCDLSGDPIAYDQGELLVGSTQLLSECCSVSNTSDLGVACDALGFTGTFESCSSGNSSVDVALIAAGIGVTVVALGACICCCLLIRSRITKN
eukprot:g1373.t1